jgi:solute carrier family 35 protein F5
MATTEPQVPLAATDAFLARPGGIATLEEPINRLGKWRRTVGLMMLGVVVFLWTASNFLASAVLADNTYSKPFFLVYVNTSFFILPLIPVLAIKAHRQPEEIRQWKNDLAGSCSRSWAFVSRKSGHGATARPSLGRLHSIRRQQALSDSQQLLLGDRMPSSQHLSNKTYPGTPRQLTLTETTRLGFEFCILWFLANYFLGVSLQHTTVASCTILTSTSSIFTLGFGVLAKVERFTVRKLLAVFASLAGIALISSIDLSGESADDSHRGDFPAKPFAEIAVGDALALLTAIIYGIYSVFMKKRIPDESAVNMPLFFGLVGLINIIFLWPGFFILHWTGVERFEMLPAGKVTTIVLLNAMASCAADLAWGYAIVMTSPIVVTVGLSMTIPLSMIGQTVLNSQTSSLLYWVGALMVVASFLFVNQEGNKDEQMLPRKTGDMWAHDASIPDYD